MKRPLVAIVAWFAAGLLLAKFFQPPLTTLFAVSFFILILILVLEKIRPYLIWPLLVLVGWTNLACRTAVISPNDLRTLLGSEPAIATVRGKLAETPHLKIVERDEQDCGGPPRAFA